MIGVPVKPILAAFGKRPAEVRVQGARLGAVRLVHQEQDVSRRC